jgi:hypothetical protein
MNDLRSPLRTISPFAVALVMLAMAGCTKKINTIDASYISPEGLTAATAHQITWPEFPAAVSLWRVATANCDTCTPAFISVSQVYPTGPGVIDGMIFDGTAASSYQIMRRERNGGYAPLFDYLLNPVQRFAQSGWKLFTWQDGSPSGFDPPTYLGRGVVSGVITPTTPLTNVSTTGAGNPQDIFLTTDSLRTFAWTPVPTAAAYLLQVYQPKNNYPEALIQNAAPAPFATHDHREYLAVWLPATSGVIEDGKQVILSKLTFTPGGFFKVRVSAVDTQGRLVGFSYGDLASVIGPGEGYFRTFRGGAFQAVAAKTPPAGPTPANARFKLLPAASARALGTSLRQVGVRF